MEKIKNPKFNRNPKGHGGFGFHPEHQSPGGWDKNNSVSYWMHYFLKLTVIDFKKLDSAKSESKRTVAESLAYARVSAAHADLKECREVMNRAEGYPKQSIDQSVSSQNDFKDYTEEELHNETMEIIIRNLNEGGYKVFDSQNREVPIAGE